MLNGLKKLLGNMQKASSERPEPGVDELPLLPVLPPELWAGAAAIPPQHRKFTIRKEDGLVYMPVRVRDVDGLIPLDCLIKGSGLCITGSRDFADWSLVEAALNSLPSDIHVIVGDARGVDAHVRSFCERAGIHYDVHVPDWNEYGKAAGPIRNTVMVSVASDVLGFWDGKSTGTLDCLKKAAEAEKYIGSIPPRPEWLESETRKAALTGESLARMAGLSTAVMEYDDVRNK